MTTNQEARQIAIRDVTSTTGNTSSDWHALFDDASIAAGPFNARMLAWINDQLGTSYTNLPGAMHAYAVDQGFSSWASMASFTPGSSLSAYAVNDNDPATVADFAGVLNSGTAYYRTGGSATTFADMFTFSRSGNATMVDSDGNLKWAPHNFATYSDDLTNAAWLKSNSDTTTATTHTPSTSSGFHDLRQSYTYLSGVFYTLQAVVAANGYDYVRTRLFFNNQAVSQVFNLATGSVGTAGSNGTSFAKTTNIESLGGGEYLITLRGASNNILGGGNFQINAVPSDSEASFAGDGTSGVVIKNIRLYRSDLGGMVNNWDRGDSYVPTTSAARFLARRGHHRGGTNKGILLESAAATNLALHNRDFTNAAWTKTNMTAAKTATGIDGVSNSASTLTATAGNATVTQAITSTSAARVTSMWVKRRTGSGNIDMTQDNGSTWTTVTVTADWTRVYIPAVTSANPTVGIRIVTSGDAIDVDMFQHEAGSVPSSEIPTTSATATRPAETLTIAGAKMAASTTAMSFQMQGEMSYGSDRSLWQWQQSTSERILCYIDYLNNRIVALQTSASATDFAQPATGMTKGTINEIFNVATRHTSGAINAASKGSATTADLTPTALADLSAQTFVVGYNNQFVGTIALFRQWDVDLGDSGIETASS